MIVFTSWLDKEFDITIDTGEPSKYIESFLSDVSYKKRWIHKENKYILQDKQPIDKQKYDLVYEVKKEYNEDVDEFKFIIFLARQAVDYINNLELIYNNSKED